jgi:hypothetical protein
VKRLDNEHNSYDSHEISEATVDESAANQISVISVQDLAGSPTESHMVKEIVYKVWFLNKHLPPEFKNNARSVFIQWVDMTKKKQYR